jgi:O-antigen/teichoic acid export membrane protein
MLAETAESPPVTESGHRSSFFRQSGWLMFANIAGGALMYGVHFLNRFIPGTGEYSQFGALLTVVMLVPNIPLQMVLAQQTAKALATNRRGELAGVIRWVFGATFAVWLVGAALVLALQGQILARLDISSPVTLWITLVVVLLAFWTPLVQGALQGEQNFLWLGWSMMSNAIGRIAVAFFAVLALHFYAEGMIAGVLAGCLAAMVLASWQSRALWLHRAEAFDWRGLLRQVVPLMLAFLGFQILFTADTLFVRAYFSGAQADHYFLAGTLARALMWLVLPLAAVMFPRLVHSAARSEKTSLLGLVLVGTGALAVLGTVSLCLLGPWVVFLMKPEYVKDVPPILPWYASAMIPLAVANVLLNHLLARPASKLPLALAVLGLALGYLAALTQFHESLVMVLKTLGVCNLLLLGVCAAFSWRGRSQAGRVDVAAPAGR